MDVCALLRAFVNLRFDKHAHLVSARSPPFVEIIKNSVGVTLLPQPQDGFRSFKGGQEMSSCKCIPCLREMPILLERDQNLSKVCHCRGGFGLFAETLCQNPYVFIGNIDMVKIPMFL
jgi:hypothetical protein